MRTIRQTHLGSRNPVGHPEVGLLCAGNVHRQRSGFAASGTRFAFGKCNRFMSKPEEELSYADILNQRTARGSSMRRDIDVFSIAVFIGNNYCGCHWGFRMPINWILSSFCF